MFAEALALERNIEGRALSRHRYPLDRAACNASLGRPSYCPPQHKRFWNQNSYPIEYAHANPLRNLCVRFRGFGARSTSKAPSPPETPLLFRGRLTERNTHERAI